MILLGWQTIVELTLSGLEHLHEVRVCHDKAEEIEALSDKLTMKAHVRVHLVEVVHVIKADVVELLGWPVVAVGVALKTEEFLDVVNDLLVQSVLNLASPFPVG
jgi:hypothetical protein